MNGLLRISMYSLTYPTTGVSNKHSNTEGGGDMQSAYFSMSSGEYCIIL